MNISELPALVLMGDLTPVNITVATGVTYPNMVLIHRCCSTTHIVARALDEKGAMYGLGPFLFIHPSEKNEKDQAACLGMSIMDVN